MLDKSQVDYHKCTHHEEAIIGCCKKCPRCHELIFLRHFTTHVSACNLTASPEYHDPLDFQGRYLGFDCA